MAKRGGHPFATCRSPLLLLTYACEVLLSPSLRVSGALDVHADVVVDLLGCEREKRGKAQGTRHGEGN